VRASDLGGGRTLVEVAGLARTDSDRLGDEVDDLTAGLRAVAVQEPFDEED
jgi:hypothetical protein